MNSRQATNQVQPRLFEALAENAAIVMRAAKLPQAFTRPTFQEAKASISTDHANAGGFPHLAEKLAKQIEGEVIILGSVTAADHGSFWCVTTQYATLTFRQWAYRCAQALERETVGEPL